MRHHLHAGLLLTTSLLAQVAPPTAVPRGVQAHELMQIVAHLAADEMRGRATGSKEQIAASNFVAEQFAALGLELLGDAQDGKRTWLQWFPIEQLAAAPESKFVVDGTMVPNQFAVMTATPLAANVTGTMQFCGLGRTGGEHPNIRTSRPTPT